MEPPTGLMLVRVGMHMSAVRAPDVEMRPAVLPSSTMRDTWHDAEASRSCSKRAMLGAAQVALEPLWLMAAGEYAKGAKGDEDREGEEGGAVAGAGLVL